MTPDSRAPLAYIPRVFYVNRKFDVLQYGARRNLKRQSSLLGVHRVHDAFNLL